MKSGKLFIITGTSAVGKTTVANGVLKKAFAKGGLSPAVGHGASPRLELGTRAGKKNLKRSLTYTSRAPRGYEKNKVDYNFISEEEFKTKIKKLDFLEWANNYGNLYGTNKQDISKILATGNNALVVIDIKGALNIKKKWPKKSVTIFILPESLNQLKQRFKKRKDTQVADIKKRLETAKWELDQSAKCDYWVINRENKVNLTVNEILEIINKS